jgi:hypothetical protein
MDPLTIGIIAELLKMTVSAYTAYMRQQGATEEQIEQMFQEAKKGMLDRNPADIP